MAKPKWLKSSYWKNELYKLSMKRLVKEAQKPVVSERKNLLIFAGGGLGDTMVHLPLIISVLKNYTEGNVYIAIEDKWVKHYQEFGFYEGEFIVYTYSNNIAQRKRINQECFKKIADLNIDKTLMIARYEDFHNYIRTNELVTYFDTQIKRERKICANNVIDLMNAYNFEVFREKIGDPFGFKWDEQSVEYDEEIIVGVGSANKSKIMDLSNFIPIIERLHKKFPNKRIVLLGSGEAQNRYAEEIVEYFSDSRVLNRVNQNSIIESLEIVNSAFLFIGFDSGLYNAAAIFGRKTVGLSGIHTGFEHRQLKNVYTIIGKGSTKESCYYGNEAMNHISIEEVEDALIKIGV